MCNIKYISLTLENDCACWNVWKCDVGDRKSDRNRYLPVTSLHNPVSGRLRNRRSAWLLATPFHVLPMNLKRQTGQVHYFDDEMIAIIGFDKDINIKRTHTVELKWKYFSIWSSFHFMHSLRIFPQIDSPSYIPKI